jgi:hypothetical protein
MFGCLAVPISPDNWRSTVFHIGFLKNPSIRNFCISENLAVPVSPDNWRSTVLHKRFLKNPSIRNFCMSRCLAVPISPDTWRSTVLHQGFHFRPRNLFRLLNDLVCSVSFPWNRCSFFYRPKCFKDR